MLYIIGGVESVKKGWFSALLSGISIGISTLIFVVINVPILIVGVLAGGFTMILLYIFCRSKEKETNEKINRKDLLRSLSPWIILITFALIISIPQISLFLKDIDGTAFSIFDRTIDFDVFTQIYFWIFLATIISIPLLKFNKGGIKKVTTLWTKRIVQPFLAYSLFFAIAYIMAWSAMDVVGGNLLKNSYFSDFNMNMVVASTLAGIFGGTFVYVAAWLGLFGAVVGGSEASSNVMFHPIQKNIAGKIGLTDDQFMTMYAAHANGGGVASAITPSKINNAVVTINEKSELESVIMKKHLPITIAITIVIGLMNALFIMWSL
jgi:lactate permease